MPPYTRFYEDMRNDTEGAPLTPLTAEFGEHLEDGLVDLSEYTTTSPGVSLVTSTTLPASPAAGQIVYEDDTNRLRLYDAGWKNLLDLDTWPENGAGPSFLAYRSGTVQGVGNGAWTVVQLQAEEEDSHSCYSISTYRFTPTLAGLYQVTGQVCWNNDGSVSVDEPLRGAIAKNGARIQTGYQGATGPGSLTSIALARPVRMNGTTDYLELHAWQNAVSVLNLNFSTGGSEHHNFLAAVRIKP